MKLTGRQFRKILTEAMMVCKPGFHHQENVNENQWTGGDELAGFTGTKAVAEDELHSAVYNAVMAARHAGMEMDEIQVTLDGALQYTLRTYSSK